MNAEKLNRFRVPLGSLMIDASLVVALIWWGATITERLETMSRDIATIQSNGTAGAVHQINGLQQRIAVAETQQQSMDRRLARIEEKIDVLLERRP